MADRQLHTIMAIDFLANCQLFFHTQFESIRIRMHVFQKKTQLSTQKKKNWGKIVIRREHKLGPYSDLFPFGIRMSWH